MAPEDGHTAFACECVRLSELTDNPDLRSYLRALALETMAGRPPPERDDHSTNVIEFPGLAAS